MATAVAKTRTWSLEIVMRNELHRFVILPKRWFVGRIFAWINRCRRLAKDFERHACKAVAFIRLAVIRLVLRRLRAPFVMSKRLGTAPSVREMLRSVWTKIRVQDQGNNVWNL